MTDRITDYQSFFHYYLREHSNPLCRATHYLGTTLGFAFWGYAIYDGQLIYFLYGLLAGYACAWIGHFFIEKNKPATFQYPFWSFISDFKMYFLWVTGRLNAHLKVALVEK